MNDIKMPLNMVKFGFAYVVSVQQKAIIPQILFSIYI